jgi:hypothetical protein
MVPIALLREQEKAEWSEKQLLLRMVGTLAQLFDLYKVICIPESEASQASEGAASMRRAKVARDK